MSHFIQLHILTFYPASNLNRDDLGRPKTVRIGGKQRLRISSQCNKRNWRTSDVFKQALGSNGKLELSEAFQNALEASKIKLHPLIGVRTKDIGIAVYNALLHLAGVDEPLDEEGNTRKPQTKWAQAIAERFGSKDSEKKGKPYNHLKTKQAFLFSMDELQAIDQLTQTLTAEPKDGELDILSKDHQMVDIAMFGRMLAHDGTHKEEAAVQVAHAFTVHEVDVEDDYFTAVDDLNLAPEAGAGSAFLDTAQFGAGLFYLYVCIDRKQLVENLEKAGGEDAEQLANRTIKALTKAATQVTPSGKRNPHGHHTYAHYVLAECGVQQPRSLAVAFLEAVKNDDMLGAAIERLQKVQNNMDDVYGPCADDRYEVIPLQGKGKFDDLYAFVGGQGCKQSQKAQPEAQS